MLELNCKSDTFEKKVRDYEIQVAREKNLLDYVNERFPAEVNAKYSIDSMGKNMIRIFIYIDSDKETKKTDTAKLYSWLAKLCKNENWTMPEANVRGENDIFWVSWLHGIKDDLIEMGFGYGIFLEHASKMKCRIITKEDTVKRYSIDDCM